MNTDTNEFLTDLDGGNFDADLMKVLAANAMSAINQIRVAKVAIQFKLTPIGKGNQVMVTHTISYERPTEKGQLTEKQVGETPMYVNEDGRLTFFPVNQGTMFDKQGDIARETYPTKSK